MATVSARPGGGAGGDLVDGRGAAAHDTVQRCCWPVRVADAVKVKGRRGLPAKTDRIDDWVLAELWRRP
jgi:hypothetical protein